VEINASIEDGRRHPRDRHGVPARVGAGALE
jgi:hypothetical protein